MHIYASNVYTNDLFTVRSMNLLSRDLHQRWHYVTLRSIVLNMVSYSGSLGSEQKIDQLNLFWNTT